MGEEGLLPEVEDPVPPLLRVQNEEVEGPEPFDASDFGGDDPFEPRDVVNENSVGETDEGLGPQNYFEVNVDLGRRRRRWPRHLCADDYDLS